MIRLPVISLLLACVCQVCAGQSAPDLNTLLGRLDALAPQFRAATASLRMDTYTAVLDDHTVERGRLRMQKLSSTDARAIVEFANGSDSRTLAFLDRELRIFYPNLKLVQIYDLGRSTELLNQFLLLGFGASGKDLARHYHVEWVGAETLGSQSTAVVNLVPKDKKTLEHLSKATVWFVPTGDHPVQQKFYEPSGNYRLVTYTNYQQNPTLSQGALTLKLPAGTKEERPQ